jgi:hypothetical protein
MYAGLDSVLWEDLNNIQGQTHKAIEMLQVIVRAIQDGRIGQPTPQDSKRLDRLIVLAELLYAEINRWTDDLNISLPKNGKSSPATQM